MNLEEKAMREGAKITWLNNIEGRIEYKLR